MTPISSQDLTEVFKKWGKIAVPCASVGGFICDVLTPLGNVLVWVLIISLITAAVTGIVWFLIKGRQFKEALADGQIDAREIEKLKKKNPWSVTFAFSTFTSIIVTLFIGLQNATGSDLKGVVASQVPAVADFQSRLLGLETKVSNIDRRTIDMQASLQKIENKISSDPRVVEKLESIRQGDLQGTSRQIERDVGQRIAFTVDWKSFEQVSYVGAQELGSTVQFLAEVIVNMSKNPEDLELIKSKIKSIHFQNSNNETPVVKFESGELVIKAAYGSIEWSRDQKVSDLIRLALR